MISVFLQNNYIVKRNLTFIEIYKNKILVIKNHELCQFQPSIPLLRPSKAPLMLIFNKKHSNYLPKLVSIYKNLLY